MTRTEEVKAFFDQPGTYLNYDYNLRIRLENVQAFLGDGKLGNVLDMPCGNGDISAPLLPQCERLVMVDFASGMTELAREKIPEQALEKTAIITDDFYNVSLEEQSFDVVISLGILAHIDSPEKFIQRIAELVKPGGSLIIQNTDSAHFYGWLIRLYLGVRRLVGKDKYRLNKVKSKAVENQLVQHGFEVVNKYRYNQSFLGFSKLFSNEKKYTLTRNFFGTVGNNKHAGWGCDYTWHFKRK